MWRAQIGGDGGLLRGLLVFIGRAIFEMNIGRNEVYKRRERKKDILGGGKSVYQMQS